jgi:hypothetical protein
MIVFNSVWLRCPLDLLLPLPLFQHLTSRVSAHLRQLQERALS